MASGPDDPRRDARRYGPPSGQVPPGSVPPNAERRSRAAQAWSELEENADRTAVMPQPPNVPPTGVPPIGAPRTGIPSTGAVPPRFGPTAPPGSAPSGPLRTGVPRPGVPLSRPGPAGLNAPSPHPTRQPVGPGVPPPFRPATPGRVPVPAPAPRRHRTPGGIIAGRIIAAVLAIAVLAVTGFYSVFVSKTNSTVATGGGIAAARSNQSKASGTGAAAPIDTPGQNILLVGSDARMDAQGNPLTPEELKQVGTESDGGSINTDTILLLHIPAGGGKATAVSIPRDTYIPKSVSDSVIGPYDDGTTGTYKPNKINSYYGTAAFYYTEAQVAKGVAKSAALNQAAADQGEGVLINIVQNFTGVKIDHYATVNLIGFYTLSEAIGGVPVCLNAAVKDSFSGANFKAGPQNVEGSSAMAFVRQRHGLPGGDLDRVRRQQAFLAGATSKMLSAGVLTSPSALNRLADAAKKSLVLDQGFDLLTFAEQMQNMSGGNVNFTTIPTHGSAADSGTDALATDPAEIKSFFGKLMGTSSTGSTAKSTAKSTASSAAATSASVDPSTVTVDVQDATTSHNSGDAMRDKLQRDGFRPGQSVDFDGVRATTTVGYPAGGLAAAQAVVASLGGGNVVADNNTEKGHITVVVGDDLAGSNLRMPGHALAATTGPTTTPSKAGNVITANGVQCVN